MCLIPRKAKNNKPAARPARSVEEMLHEIAFVLRMTKQVKESILADRAELKGERPNSEADLNLVSA
jgi:hypothetical protein